MSDDPGVVRSDDHVLRRIHISLYDPGLPTPIQRGAFKPSPEDTDGLSFYLEKSVTPRQLAASGRLPPDQYIIARLNVGDILALGLRLVPTPEKSELPGHVSLIDINTETYQNDKNRMKTLCFELSKIASRDVILHG